MCRLVALLNNLNTTQIKYLYTIICFWVCVYTISIHLHLLSNNFPFLDECMHRIRNHITCKYFYAPSLPLQKQKMWNISRILFILMNRCRWNDNTMQQTMWKFVKLNHKSSITHSVAIRDSLWTTANMDLLIAFKF